MGGLCGLWKKNGSLGPRLPTVEQTNEGLQSTLGTKETHYHLYNVFHNLRAYNFIFTINEIILMCSHYFDVRDTETNLYTARSHGAQYNIDHILSWILLTIANCCQWNHQNARFVISLYFLISMEIDLHISQWMKHSNRSCVLYLLD